MRKFAALAAVFLAAANLPAGNIRTPGPDYSQFEKKLSKDQSIVHALNRLAFGPRPGDVEAVKKMGLEKWIDLQLHPERLPDYTPGSALAPPQQKMLRAVYSSRQLEEMLVDFWYNHFNVDISKGADRRLVP